MFKDETGEIVPAIVTEELWDKANDILTRRSDDVKSRQGKCNRGNLLTGKLFCTECGLPYYRRSSRSRKQESNSKWICSGKINNGAGSCSSFPIYEDEIKPLLFEVFTDTEKDVDALIEQYAALFRRMSTEGDVKARIDSLKTQQVAIQDKQKQREEVRSRS